MPGYRNVIPTVVEVGTGSVFAYVKSGEASTLFREAVCSLLALELGVPVPLPLVIEDHGEKKFGSVAVGEGDLLTLVKSGDYAVADKLAIWPDLAICAVFDQLIGQSDRNKGSLLYDGAEGFFMIDHAESMGPNKNQNHLLKLAITTGRQSELESAVKSLQENDRTTQAIRYAVRESRDAFGVTNTESEDVESWLNDSLGNLLSVVVHECSSFRSANEHDIERGEP